MTNETGKNPKAAKRIGKAQNSNPTIGSAQHKLHWIDRQLEETRHWKPETERLPRENPKAARRIGKPQRSYPTKLGTAQTSWDLLTIGWMKPPWSSGRWGSRLMEILAFLSMDASGRHPIEDARCFGLLLCCHWLVTFWGGLRFRRRSDGSRRTGGLVGLRFLWQAGPQQVFNWLRIDVLSFLKQAFLQTIPKMIKITEWRQSIASLDLINGPFQLAILPQPMKQPLTHHALRQPIFLRHTIPSAKDATWKLLQMLGTVTLFENRLRSKRRTTSAINVKMPGNNVQQVSAPGRISNSSASFYVPHDLELQLRHIKPFEISAANQRSKRGTQPESCLITSSEFTS